MSYRVVYGETRPAWEQIFPTMREAKAFAKNHKSFGDVIFSVRKVVPGEKPQSMTAWLASGVDPSPQATTTPENSDGV